MRERRLAFCYLHKGLNTKIMEMEKLNTFEKYSDMLQEAFVFHLALLFPDSVYEN